MKGNIVRSTFVVGSILAIWATMAPPPRPNDSPA